MNKPGTERSVDSIPRGEESDDSKWQILADLGDKERGSAPATAEAEPDHHKGGSKSAEEEREYAAAEVKKVYANLNQTESAPEITPPGGANTTKTEIQESAYSDKPRGLSGAIASAYERQERARIDELKKKFWRERNAGSRELYEHYYYDSLPRPQIGTMGKFLRLVRGALPITSKRREERLNREAADIAIKEFDAEFSQMRREKEAKSRAEWWRKELRRKEEEAARKAAAEKAAITEYMSNARYYFERHKRERLQRQRIQEAVERDLNSRLTTIDDLEEQIALGAPGITKREIPYEGENITVYELSGLPFAALTTTVDYRSANKPGDIGTETYKAIMNDPSIWIQRRDKAEKSDGYGTRSANARGNTISFSYRNSEKNLTSYVPGELVYGCTKVRGSIINVKSSDAGSENTIGDMETILSDLDAIDKLEGPSPFWETYTDITTRRYDENGTPWKPDYISVTDGGITDLTLKHAKFFGVPIIDKKEKIYQEKAKRRGEAILEKITPDSSWEEVKYAFEELKSMSYFKSGLPIRRSSEGGLNLPDSASARKQMAASELEFDKRMEHTKDILEQAATSLESTGEVPKEIKDELPFVSIYDAERMIEINNYTWEKWPGNDEMRSRIELDYHGRNYFSGKTDLWQSKTTTESNQEFARGRYYDMLAPVAMRYLQALWKSKGKRDPTTLPATWAKPKDGNVGLLPLP